MYNEKQIKNNIMPEFNTYVDVEVYEIWDSCSTSEKNELTQADLLSQQLFHPAVVIDLAVYAGKAVTSLCRDFCLVLEDEDFVIFLVFMFAFFNS